MEINMVNQNYEDIVNYQWSLVCFVKELFDLLIDQLREHFLLDNISNWILGEVNLLSFNMLELYVVLFKIKLIFYLSFSFDRDPFEIWSLYLSLFGSSLNEYFSNHFEQTLGVGLSFDSELSFRGCVLAFWIYHLDFLDRLGNLLLQRFWFWGDLNLSTTFASSNSWIGENR